MATETQSPAMPLKDAPDLLKGKTEQKRRAEMLALPHVKPLEDYLAASKARCGEGREMPHFDPCDGGINARALFLLEAPGPQAVGSTFISRDNPDPTARNLWRLMRDADIPRSDTVLWNVVPWYVGVPGRIRPVTRADVQEALPYLRELLSLLTHLQMIILVGRKAQSATKAIQAMAALPIVPTYHPSARVFNVWPDKERQTQEKFVAVAKLCREGPR